MPKLSSRYKGHPISTAHPASVSEILPSLISEVSQESPEASAAMKRPKFCSFGCTRVSALKGVKANTFTFLVLTPGTIRGTRDDLKDHSLDLNTCKYFQALGTCWRAPTIPACSSRGPHSGNSVVCRCSVPPNLYSS